MINRQRVAMTVANRLIARMAVVRQNVPINRAVIQDCRRMNGVRCVGRSMRLDVIFMRRADRL
jgi:hypothetical protein